MFSGSSISKKGWAYVCACLTDIPGSVGCTRSDPELIKNRGGGVGSQFSHSH